MKMAKLILAERGTGAASRAHGGLDPVLLLAKGLIRL